MAARAKRQSTATSAAGLLIGAGLVWFLSTENGTDAFVALTTWGGSVISDLVLGQFL